MKFRIHPAIGLARVGNSQDYYIEPQTIAGMPQEGSDINGGLPIQPGTDNETITSADIRDPSGALKRQAARFTVHVYDDAPIETWPSGQGTPVAIGDALPDGRKVSDIIWTVHLANKKANCWLEVDEEGLASYENGGLPALRNPDFGGSDDPSAPERLSKLIIDAGPRSVQGAGASTEFDTATPASYWKADGNGGGAITEIADYPKQFPDTTVFPDLHLPAGEGISTLGGLRTDDKGRLEVLGGHGLANGFGPDAVPLQHDVNNNGWLDDTSDGPVTAVLVLDDGSHLPLEGSAWAVATDPAYAPQTMNVVSLWDDVYNTWIEQLNLNPEVYSDGKYNTEYRPDFYTDVFPVFRAASLQMWNTNLPDSAIAAHDSVDKITPADDPTSRLYVKALIRDPNADQFDVGAPLMPLSLGDAGKPFLALSTTQYFFVTQWFDNKFTPTPEVPPAPGEQLDRTVLQNCLGGRFSPGIDLTFIVRDTELYNPDWTNPAIGPFRIKQAPLDYSDVQAGQPFLGVGYTPTRPGQPGVEPGDICKFMAIPWHTDYNSCATHLPEPNPGANIEGRDSPHVFQAGVNTSLFWSWPAQRPVAVYTFDDLAANAGKLPKQRFSVRGEGTKALPSPEGPGPFPAQNVGRFQKRENMLDHWQKIGVVMQGPAIEGYDASYPKNYYLEVMSQFQDDADPVIPWPNTIVDNPSG